MTAPINHHELKAVEDATKRVEDWLDPQTTATGIPKRELRLMIAALRVWLPKSTIDCVKRERRKFPTIGNKR